MELDKKIEEYFQGQWPGTETSEQCNTNLTFTPPAIRRMVEHFYNLGKNERLFHSDDLDVEIEKYFHNMELRGDTPGVPDEYIDDTTVDKIARHFVTWEKNREENYHLSCGARGRQGGVPEEIFEKANEYVKTVEPPYDKDDICSAYETGSMDQRKDIHWISDRTMKLIQKSWYLEGWHDNKFDQPQQFEIGPDLEQKYHPSHMSVEDVQALIDRNYENGKKDKEEELMKLAFPYKLIGRNTIEHLDMDELDKRGIHWGDNIKVIILKDE